LAAKIQREKEAEKEWLESKIKELYIKQIGLSEEEVNKMAANANSKKELKKKLSWKSFKKERDKNIGPTSKSLGAIQEATDIARYSFFIACFIKARFTLILLDMKKESLPFKLGIQITKYKKKRIRSLPRKK
jgi:hypothetical protein